MENKRSLVNFAGLLVTFVLVAMSQTAHGVERISYYHNDHLGSPVVATNPQGAVIWRESYQPYGTREHQGGNQNSLWFTGKQEEASFGVSYFGARWYDPEMGRFLAMDPVGISPGDPHSFNRYAYTNNNPYRFVDPDGKHPVAYGVIAIITTGGIVTIAALPSQARNEVARSLIRISKVLEEQKPYKPPLVGPVPAQDFDEIIYSSKLFFWRAYREKRTRIFAGFFMFALIMYFVAFLSYPDWVIPFLRATFNHLRVDFGFSAHAVLVDLFPAQGKTLGWILTIGLVIALGYEWSLTIGADFRRFYWASCLSLAAAPLLGFRTEMEHLIVLVIPLPLVFAVVHNRWRQFGGWLTFLLMFFIFAIPWTLYFLSLTHDH